MWECLDICTGKQDKSHFLQCRVGWMCLFSQDTWGGGCAWGRAADHHCAVEVKREREDEEEEPDVSVDTVCADITSILLPEIPTGNMHMNLIPAVLLFSVICLRELSQWFVFLANAWKDVYLECNILLLWIKASAKCINVNTCVSLH